MSNKAKIREEAKKLNPIDDLMFRKMAEDKGVCQEILRVILEEDNLVVLESIPQWTGANLHPLYHVDRKVRETGKAVDNGFEEVYVNTEIKNNSEVSELMEVFLDDNAYNSKFPKTSDSKHRYKETEGGLNVMCEIMERITEDERKELIT